MMLISILICFLLATFTSGFISNAIRTKSTLLMSTNDIACDTTKPCPYASKCSGEYRTKGCDGTGKIQGGIATYPFFGWWPIKVFRPCPSYLQAGYVYKREGQTMDQVLFSEPSTKMKEKMESIRLQTIQQEREDRKAATSTANQSKLNDISTSDNKVKDKQTDSGDADAALKLLNERFGTKDKE